MVKYEKGVDYIVDTLEITQGKRRVIDFNVMTYVGTDGKGNHIFEYTDGGEDKIFILDDENSSKHMVVKVTSHRTPESMVSKKIYIVTKKDHNNLVDDPVIVGIFESCKSAEMMKRNIDTKAYEVEIRQMFNVYESHPELLNGIHNVYTITMYEDGSIPRVHSGQITNEGIFKYHFDHDINEVWKKRVNDEEIVTMVNVISTSIEDAIEKGREIILDSEMKEFVSC